MSCLRNDETRRSGWHGWTAILAALSALLLSPAADGQASRPATQPATQSAASAPAKVEKMASRRQFLPGSWAQGTFGDWKLANGLLAVIVSGGAPEGKEPAPCRIVDAAQLADPYDQLQGIEPVAFLGEDVLKIETGPGKGGGGAEEATLVFQGAVSGKKGLNATTEYTLRRGQPIVRVVTTLKNASSETFYNLGLGDRVEWALFSPFVERFGMPDFRQVEVTYSGWIAGRIDRTTLGIAIRDGQIEAQHLEGASHLRYATTRALAPGKSLTAEREIYIGGPNMSSFTDYAQIYRNEPHGVLKSRVLETASKKPLAGIPVKFEIYKKSIIEPGQEPKEREAIVPLPYTTTLTDKDGNLAVSLPEGRYFVNPVDFSHAAMPLNYTIDITPGATVERNPLGVHAETKLVLRVVDAATSQTLPCKVQVQSIKFEYPLNYGPPYETRGVRNFWHLPTGTGEIPLPFSGRCQVLVSRGPEYTMEELIVESKPGLTISREVKLRRVVDTTGYLSVDLDVQTNASPDCRVAPQDTAIAAACEGVEWLVSADVNQATDLAPAIKAAKLEKWVGSSRGMRLMPDSRDWKAHFTAFPVTGVNPGEYTVRDWIETSEPAPALDRARREFPNSLLAVHTPYSLTEGYFLGYKFDAKARRAPEASGISYAFDLLSVFDGRLFGDSAMDFSVYNGCSLWGHDYCPIGASSSREIFGNEPGYPRTYVAVPNDDPAKATEADIIAGLRKKDVVVTNGPFIRVRCQGKGPGEVVQPINKKLSLEVEVWAAPGIPVAGIEIWRDHQWTQGASMAPGDSPLRFPAPQSGRSKTIELEYVTGEISVQVVARAGRDGVRSVASIEGRGAADTPIFAVTGPIYVDGNCDGKFAPVNDGQPRSIGSN